MQPKNPEESREKNQKYAQPQRPSTNNNGGGQKRPQISPMKTNRGESIRAGRRNFDDADKAVDRWDVYEKNHKEEVTINKLMQNDVLRIVPLGGLSEIGEKNMMVIEYADDAIVVDCGFDLSIDLPGVNFGIPVTQYLESIKHKLYNGGVAATIIERKKSR